MPLVEVIHAAKEPATSAQKRALAEDFVEIFKDVLGTSDGRLRVFFYPVNWEDSLDGMLEVEGDDDG